MNDIQGFTFFRSYYESLKELEEKDKKDIAIAIIEFIFEDKEPNFNGSLKAIWILMKANLNVSKIKSKSKRNQNEIKTESNQNQNEMSDLLEDKDKEYRNKDIGYRSNNDVGESCVDGLQEIIDFYNNNVGQMTPYGITLIESYLKEMDKDLIIYAMQISVEANKRSIQYIKAILNNWQKSGIKTLVEAQKEHKKPIKKVKEESENLIASREALEDLDLYDN